MDLIKNPADLIKIFQDGITQRDEAQDTKKFRYVIYVRKSSESAEKQVRSLGDQILECREKAEDLGLTVIGPPIQEPSSASEPDIREKFRGMLEDIKKGKYDGIIAWHPDRLARNMKDAGEIIDLLDKKIIKDLKFVSFSFDNTTAGKMLLGITFVLSKQYSDQLGDNVRRGNKRSIEEGKYIGNKAPHGYYKDRNQLLRPDGENFILIQHAFNSKIEGRKTLEEIAEYLNENGYSIRDSSGKFKKYKMTKQRVSDFLRNPIYTGVLVHGENTADLTELFDFVPAITVEQFLSINKFSDFKSPLVNSNFHLAKIHQRVRKANLLRGMVICGECGQKMAAGITVKKTGQHQKYFFYRCHTETCPRKGKSVRAKLVMDFIYLLFDNVELTSKEIHKYFLQQMEEVQHRKMKEYESRLRSLGRNRRVLQEKEKSLKDYIPLEEDEAVRRSYKNDLKDTSNALGAINQKIEEVQELSRRNKSVKLSYQKFHELFENLAQKLKEVKKMDELDFILRIIFTNFVIKDGKVAQYKLKPPFSEVVHKQLVLNGGDGGTRTRDLLRDRQTL